MSTSDCYGTAFGNRLSAQANSFVTRALPKSTLAVTELRYDVPQFILSVPPAEEDAFVLGVHLELFERYTYWENGKAAPVSTLQPGETIIYHINRKPTFYLNSSFHSVHFYVPVSALHAIADEVGASRINELHYRPAVSHGDPLLHNIAGALLPSFRTPGRVNQVFIDHLMLAVGHHVAVAYGGMSVRSKPVSGGLTPLQERRAKDLVAVNLSGNLRLSDLANECGLSTSQFARAFRKSTGLPPHRWLLQQRVEQAKTLLRNREMSLSQVATISGFFDQSHFTRCFSTYTGMTPALWRRSKLS